MKLKTIATLFALLLASGVGCGQQNPESTGAPSAPQSQATAPQTPAPTAETPAAEQAASTGETVQEGAENASASTADAANILLAQAVTGPKTEPSSRWKAGTHYTEIKPAQPTGGSPDKVQVTEIFWYGCPHCYSLEPYLQSWMPKKAPYIHFNRVPVIWGPVHKLHAQLYYTLIALNREDLHIVAFRESQVGDHLIGRDIPDTERVQRAFAKRQGIEEEAFTKAYNSKEVADNVARAQEITLRYKIEDVPRAVINGKYMVDITSAGGQSNLIAIINDLAASEHNKKD